MLFIGDVHGKYRQYKKIIEGTQNTIQIGDMGVGFGKIAMLGDTKQSTNPPHAKMVAGNHRFIRGNHDNPAECKKHSQWIPDGKIEGDMMFIGGGFSIDKFLRTEGLDWWPDEELSIQEFSTLVDAYAAAKPRIMVTHDCPENVAILMEIFSGRRKLKIGSRTRDAFQAMFDIHQPELWVYGHWHYSFDEVIKGTRFVCLAELECKDL